MNMLHQYIERELLRKNKGVYFKKGKWVFHVLFLLGIWLPAANEISGNSKAALQLHQSLLAALLLMLPFLVFFYYYCLYLIPNCFKRNRYRSFWTMLAASLLVFPLIHAGLETLLDHAFPHLAIRKPGIPLFKYLLQTYMNFVANFMGFTSMLFIMELLEEVRTSKEIASNKHQLEATELHLVKTRMNPEFMMGALEGIIQLSEREQEEAPNAVIQFSDVLRYRLYRSTHSEVPLEQELQQLANLFSLYDSMPGHQGLFTLETEGTVEKKKIRPLSLIHIAEQLFTTYRQNQQWSILMYILIEASELQIAIELSCSDQTAVSEKIQMIENNLSKLSVAAPIFTVESELENHSIRICIPIVAH
jgi:two-component system LytT family sensor kinase